MEVELDSQATSRYRKGHSVRINHKGSPFNGRTGEVSENQKQGATEVRIQFSANPYDSQTFPLRWVQRMG